MPSNEQDAFVYGLIHSPRHNSPKSAYHHSAVKWQEFSWLHSKKRFYVSNHHSLRSNFVFIHLSVYSTKKFILSHFKPTGLTESSTLLSMSKDCHLVEISHITGTVIPWDWTFSLHCCCCRFSRVRPCATPQTAAHQAPPSLGFSRQEHWSGLPCPFPMHENEKWKWSRVRLSDLRDCSPPGSSVHGIFPGESTRQGCHCLLLSWTRSVQLDFCVIHTHTKHQCCL